MVINMLYRVVLLAELVVEENANGVRHRVVFRIRGMSGGYVLDFLAELGCRTCRGA